MAITVDFHAHHFPVGLPDMAELTGDPRWPSLIVDDDSRLMRGSSVFRRVKASCFDPEVRLRELDAANIDHQVISPVPITLVDWAPAHQAARFLAAQNDALAETARRSNGRFIALGAVPLQDVELAIDEMARIRTELDMAGIEMPAMAAGQELDAPALDPFWAAAESEKVPLFIHPAHQQIAIRRQGQPYEFGIGMHTDTALAAAALVYGGVLDRHPDLRIALSHGCGSFAWTHPRLRYLAARDQDAASALDDLVRSLWVDGLVFDIAHIPLLVERFGADHILYGTDHPFLPDGFDVPRDLLRQGIAEAMIDERALGENALRFLGRWEGNGA